ncbi:hypothetical protein [Staphylococcus aureus]|uniref:hypothetical protein n=1 Tax=Staphylococcus aureus TaxID=1280 RepID=UPI00129FD0B5|nr:hypothetical protein [Staphylococcus aureus]AYD82571.1 hypothetical protein ART_00102 [Achromobacter phage vB_Ade_ART]MBD4207882.1 hypothetical protein [Xanthomonas citri pv. citri]
MNSLQDFTIGDDPFGPFCYRMGMDRRFWRAYDGHTLGSYSRRHYIMDDFGNLVQISN